MFASYPWTLDQLWQALRQAADGNVLATAKLGQDFYMPQLPCGPFRKDESGTIYRTLVFGAISRPPSRDEATGIVSLRITSPGGGATSLYRGQMERLNACVEGVKQREPGEVVHTLNNFLWTPNDTEIEIELMGYHQGDCLCEASGIGFMSVMDFMGWFNISEGDVALLECGLHYRKLTMPGPETVRVFRALGMKMRMYPPYHPLSPPDESREDGDWIDDLSGGVDNDMDESTDGVSADSTDSGDHEEEDSTDMDEGESEKEESSDEEEAKTTDREHEGSTDCDAEGSMDEAEEGSTYEADDEMDSTDSEKAAENYSAETSTTEEYSVEDADTDSADENSTEDTSTGYTEETSTDGEETSTDGEETSTDGEERAADGDCSDLSEGGSVESAGDD